MHNVTLTSTKTRYAVEMTTAEGRVYLKDRISGHWTTYPVSDMSLKEAREVVAYEEAKGTTSSYRIVDRDLHDGCVEITKQVRRANCEAIGYDEKSREWKESDEAKIFRQNSLLKIQLAIKEAMMKYIVENA